MRTLRHETLGLMRAIQEQRDFFPHDYDDEECDRIQSEDLIFDPQEGFKPYVEPKDPKPEPEPAQRPDVYSWCGIAVKFVTGVTTLFWWTSVSAKEMDEKLKQYRDSDLVISAQLKYKP